MQAGGSSASSPDAQPHILSLRGAAALADQVARVVEDAERQHPGVRLVCDVAPGLGMQVDPQLLARLLDALVCRACEAAAERDPHSDLPPLREVVVTAVDTPSAIEIEVADSGAARRQACPAEAASLAARLGGSLAVAACPEGGTAVTLRLPRRRAQGMAA